MCYAVAEGVDVVVTCHVLQQADYLDSWDTYAATPYSALDVILSRTIFHVCRVIKNAAHRG